MYRKQNKKTDLQLKIIIKSNNKYDKYEITQRKTKKKKTILKTQQFNPLQFPSHISISHIHILYKFSPNHILLILFNNLFKYFI